MSEFIESLSNVELNRLREQAATGGEYEAARGLLEREYQRRALAVQALHTVDMPVADPEDYLESPVHNHGPAEGRGLDCGEALVDGKLKGWCLRPPQPEEGPDYHANLAQWNTHNYIVPVDPMDDLQCEGCQ